MPKIYIELTDVEYSCLNAICHSTEEWIENLTKERARIAFNDIVQIVVENCIRENIQIPTDKYEIIQLAILKKWI